MTIRSMGYQSFRRKLMLGLLAMALLGVTLIIWGLQTSYVARKQAARAETGHLARAIEANILYSIRLADLSLLGFANAIKLLPPEQRHSPEKVRALLTSSESPYLADFWLSFIDAGGHGVATSNTQPINKFNYADRDYFQAQARSRGAGLFVGQPVIGRPTKARILLLSRRVEDPNGNFLGVILAPVDARRYRTIFEDARYNHNITVTLFHASGKVVARAPQFEATFGADITAIDPFHRNQKSGEGTYEALNPATGEEHITSFRTIGNLPLTVEVSAGNLSSDVWTNDKIVIGGVGVVLIALIMLLSVNFALRSYARVEGRERRIGQLYDSSRATEAKLSESEGRLRMIADNLPILIAYLDQRERFTFANRRYELAYDAAVETIVGSRLDEVIGAEAYASSKPYLDRALAGQPVHFERRSLRRNLPCWDRVTYVPNKNETGAIVGLFVMIEDITQRKKSEESMLLSSLVYDNTSEAMMVTDANGNIITVNPAFSKLTGYTLGEIAGHHATELASSRHDKEFFAGIRRSIASTGIWQGELWSRHKEGKNFLFAVTFNTVFDKDGNATRRVALFSDITKKRADEELIWKQANFDPLTGLANRRMFMEHLRLEMKKTDRSGQPMALIFLDLDHFKEVNDTLGHDMGDALLKEAARRLTQCVRMTDTVARLGGDEFTVILSELGDTADVARIAQDILDRMIEPFRLGDQLGQVSASVGITFYPDDGASDETLLKNADQAMYAAKQHGRNRYHYFASFMQEASQTQIQLTNQLRDAIAHGQLRMLYQVIVDLKTGEVRKAEALVRWQHPQRGLLEPNEFIPLAESTGMIVDIGDWVFREAARESKHLQELTQDFFQISINKSVQEFHAEESRYQGWLDHLEELGLPVNSVSVEITESVLHNASNVISDQLLALREAGLQVSLDKFGTAWASLSFLKNFDIDYLKLDQSIISDLGYGTNDMVLCEAIIVIAHQLGIQVIAQGVETEEQLRFLTRAGCDFGQGYLLSMPVSATELKQMLQPRQSRSG